MTTYQETPVQERSDQPSPEQKRRESLGWGGTLVALGLFFFAARFFDLGMLVLPMLALGFLGWGIASRNAGLLVPGGILAGISAGIFAIEGPLRVALSDDAEGGIFLLCFALGWASITALSALFTDETQGWALIPAAIMAFIGLAVLFGGIFTALLELTGALWPLALILGGLYLLYRNRQPVA